MKTKMLCKGISELLAIVLGVVITIAIGMTLFMLLPNYVGFIQQQQRIAITNFNINAIDTQTAVATITIRNMGTKNIEGVTIYINSSKNSIFSLSIINLNNSYNYNCTNIISNALSCRISLNPAQEFTFVVRLKTENGVVIGDKVVVTIAALFIDKSIAANTAISYIY
mgnify:CR=1 FL=1